MRRYSLVMLLLLTPVLVSGNGMVAPRSNEERGATLDDTEKGTSPPATGDFYAEVVSRDDLLAVNGFIARVRVHPATTVWPGTVIPQTAFDASIRIMIKVRGISVPTNLGSQDRPLVETRRETKRFMEAMTFVWDLMQVSDFLILHTPEGIQGTQHVACDVFFELANQRLSLAEVLVTAGHARYEPHDWGKRIVERK